MEGTCPVNTFLHRGLWEGKRNRKIMEVYGQGSYSLELSPLLRQGC